MGYKHVTVRELTKQTDPAYATLIERLDWAKAAGWQSWLDTIPVSREVYELGMGVRKAYPFVKFYATAVDNMCTWSNTGNPDVWYASEIFIAIDTCPYTLLKIGYGQYQVTGNTVSRYIVSARNIRNDKYYIGREQHYMRITSSLKSAVKNTLANLLPYTTNEIAKHEYLDYHGKSKKISVSKAAQLPALLGSITHSVLLNEIRALKAAGGVFSTPEFRSVAESCDEAAKLANEERNKQVAAILIHFVTRSDGIVAECAGMQNIRNQSEFRLDLSATYPIADVPQALQDKVAVLQTLLPGDHVDGVGMKVEDMLYWVEK